MQYTTAPGTQGICPPGWHIPTYAEFQTFRTAVGNDGNALKAVGQGTGGGAGTNTSGFSALLAGYRFDDGDFLNLGSHVYFWSSTEYDASTAYGPYLSGVDAFLDVSYPANKVDGFSVRCIED